MELNVSNLPREHTLNYISAIKTVHTIGAHNSLLSRNYTTGLAVDQLSLTKANVKICHEVAVIKNALFDDIDQLR